MEMATHPKRKIGVIAAAGHLPVIVTEQLLELEYDPVVVALDGIADADFPIAVERIRVGALTKIMNWFKAKACDEIVMTGRFIRPSLAAIKPDLAAASLAIKALMSSDDNALRLIKDTFAHHGLHIVDMKDVLGDLYVASGKIIGRKPTAHEQKAIHKGLTVLRLMGHSDIGQAIVVQAGRVLAVEAAEGTDAMISRAGALSDPSLSPPVLVKAAKTGQDRSLDPPVIGVETVIQAAKANITVIALGAGEVLIADRENTLAAAKTHKITIIGVEG
jgi:DUF1009 family protein